MASERCAACSTFANDMKECAKCKSVFYCNKTCQKKDWKEHKKLCPHLAADRALEAARTRASQNRADNAARLFGVTTKQSAAAISKIKNLDKTIHKPFYKIESKTWLHGRSEEDVYKLLIDSFRLRVTDEFELLEFSCMVDDNPENSAALSPFLDYLVMAAPLLPGWWTKEKNDACCLYGLDSKNWSYLPGWVEKEDIEKQYGSKYMPLQLRLFAAQALRELRLQHSIWGFKIVRALEKVLEFEKSG